MVTELQVFVGKPGGDRNGKRPLPACPVGEAIRRLVQHGRSLYPVPSDGFGSVE
jgi:hypothetical protein